jgi:hypothetical protein
MRCSPQLEGKNLKVNPPLFHKTHLGCAKPVQNKFFSRATSTPTATSVRWKRNQSK